MIVISLQVAQECGFHNTVGIDLVAMSVNDILAQGAEPLFFLDYFASGKLSTEVVKHVVTGVAQGCALAGCALLGGMGPRLLSFYSMSCFSSCFFFLLRFLPFSAHSFSFFPTFVFIFLHGHLLAFVCPSVLKISQG